MGIVECTFNSVNGQNTAVNVRTGPSVSYSIIGTLIKKNHKSFYVDTSVSGGNSWYKLHEPEKYGIKSNGKTVYVRLLKSYLLSPDPSTLTASSGTSSTSTTTNTNKPATNEEI